MAAEASPAPRIFNGFGEITSFIWSVADLLRGDYKQADYGKVILPLTVLRRLDCVLDPTREQVLKKAESLKGGQENIDAITKLYGDFKASEHSKIFANEDFGYRKIVVERPLRLNFQASKDRLDRLREERGLVGLAESKKKGAAGEREAEEGKKLQAAILAALKTLGGEKICKKRSQFEKALDAALSSVDIRLSAPVRKAVLSALGERDETAEVCIDAEGKPEPDSELRDNENVPLKEAIRSYFEREVKPHVPDAWVDESKTKTGYEIPFTRHFYRYQPLRSLQVIEADIRSLEQQVQSMLGDPWLLEWNRRSFCGRVAKPPVLT
jgi:type I restriction enzyme M protein